MVLTQKKGKCKLKTSIIETLAKVPSKMVPGDATAASLSLPSPLAAQCQVHPQTNIDEMRGGGISEDDNFSNEDPLLTAHTLQSHSAFLADFDVQKALKVTSRQTI